MPTDIRKVKEDNKPIYTNDPKLVEDYQERLRLFNTYQPFLNSIQTSKDRFAPSEFQKANLQVGVKNKKIEPISESVVISKFGQPFKIYQYEKPTQEYIYQKGKYRVSYYDPKSKSWDEKDFMTQKESDEFAKEMSKRGFSVGFGNITQRVEYNNKR